MKGSQNNTQSSQIYYSQEEKKQFHIMNTFQKTVQKQMDYQKEKVQELQTIPSSRIQKKFINRSLQNNGNPQKTINFQQWEIMSRFKNNNTQQQMQKKKNHLQNLENRTIKGVTHQRHSLIINSGLLNNQSLHNLRVHQTQDGNFQLKTSRSVKNFSNVQNLPSVQKKQPKVNSPNKPIIEKNSLQKYRLEQNKKNGENQLYRMHLVNKTISSNTIFEQLSDRNLVLHENMGYLQDIKSKLKVINQTFKDTKLRKQQEQENQETRSSQLTLINKFLNRKRQSMINTIEEDQNEEDYSLSHLLNRYVKQKQSDKQYNQPKKGIFNQNVQPITKSDAKSFSIKNTIHNILNQPKQKEQSFSLLNLTQNNQQTASQPSTPLTDKARLFNQFQNELEGVNQSTPKSRAFSATNKKKKVSFSASAGLKKRQSQQQNNNNQKAGILTGFLGAGNQFISQSHEQKHFLAFVDPKQNTHLFKQQIDPKILEYINHICQVFRKTLTQDLNENEYMKNKILTYIGIDQDTFVYKIKDFLQTCLSQKLQISEFTDFKLKKDMFEFLCKIFKYVLEQIISNPKDVIMKDTLYTIFQDKEYMFLPRNTYEEIGGLKIVQELFNLGYKEVIDQLFLQQAFYKYSDLQMKEYMIQNFCYLLKDQQEIFLQNIFNIQEDFQINDQNFYLAKNILFQNLQKISIITPEQAQLIIEKFERLRYNIIPPTKNFLRTLENKVQRDKIAYLLVKNMKFAKIFKEFNKNGFEFFVENILQLMFGQISAKKVSENLDSVLEFPINQDLLDYVIKNLFLYIKDQEITKKMERDFTFRINKLMVFQQKQYSSWMDNGEFLYKQYLKIIEEKQNALIEKKCSINDLNHTLFYYFFINFFNSQDTFCYADMDVIFNKYYNNNIYNEIEEQIQQQLKMQKIQKLEQIKKNDSNKSSIMKKRDECLMKMTQGYQKVKQEEDELKKIVKQQTQMNNQRDSYMESIKLSQQNKDKNKNENEDEVLSPKEDKKQINNFENFSNLQNQNQQQQKQNIKEQIQQKLNTSADQNFSIRRHINYQVECFKELLQRTNQGERNELYVIYKVIDKTFKPYAV